MLQQNGEFSAHTVVTYCRKRILTWPLSRLIQFTAILLQSSYENAVCRFHHCKSWDSKCLTHTRKPLHRHCIHKMILWKISNRKHIEQKSSSVFKMCEREKSWLSSWLWKACPTLSDIMPSSWQSNAAKGKMPCTLGICPRKKAEWYRLLCSWTQISCGGVRRQRRGLLTCLV